MHFVNPNQENTLAHVEINHWACETLRKRMKYYGYKDWANEVLEQDITSDDCIANIDKVVKGRKVDIIIGGPPCQAYSTAGRVRDGKRMATDSRNFLFESYVKILHHYSPKFFVFENVTGILSAKVNGGNIFNEVVNALGENYNITTEPSILVHNTADFGVPQLRKRVIIMGVRKDITGVSVMDLYNDLKKTHWNPDTPESFRARLSRYVSVKDAIGDLPPVEPGHDASMSDFDYPCIFR